MIFLLDNYDSFTYNLYQMMLGMGRAVEVGRNDRVGASEVVGLAPEAVVLSPGPGRPEDAGIMQELIGKLVEGEIPCLGVCLGMQGLGLHFGSKVVRSKEQMHGKTCGIEHDGSGVFRGIDGRITVMRYHSLALDGLHDENLVATARSDDGELMAFRHGRLPVEGLQFHPESFATEHGEKMLENFLDEHAGNGS